MGWGEEGMCKERRGREGREIRREGSRGRGREGNVDTSYRLRGKTLPNQNLQASTGP